MSKVVSDQADGLRRLMASSPGRLLAVVGSDPGAGASGVARNLVAALRQQGQDAVLQDAHDAHSGAPAQWQRDGRWRLIHAVPGDDGALPPAAVQADHVLVVFQADAASITRAYLCIKKLHYAHALQRVRTLVNGATDEAEAQRLLSNLATTGSRYLAVALEPAGWVRADPFLVQAQRLDLSVVDAFQSSLAARDFRQIASDVLQWPSPAGSGRTAPPRVGQVAQREAFLPVVGVH